MGSAVKTNFSSHLLSAGMAGAFSIAAYRHTFWTIAKDWTPDQFMFAGLPAAIIFLLVFGGGHFCLRNWKVSYSWAYSCLGVVALMASFFGTTGIEVFAEASKSGVAVIVILLAAAVGSLIGFVHFRSVGFDIEGDDPEALKQLLEKKTPSGPSLPLTTATAESSIGADQLFGTPSSQPVSTDDNSHVSTGESEYFDGPLQVVTSRQAMFVASLLGGLFYALYQTMIFGMFAQSEGGLSTGEITSYVFGTRADSSLLGSLVFGGFLGLILLPLPVYGGHLFARSKNWTSYKHYGLIGLIMPILIGLAIFIVGVFITIGFAPALAISMIVYRKLAGLEPADLPEDIQVSDRRNLVGKDHVRRRYSRLVTK